MSPAQVDVTLNNTLAIINTKLLADYCAIDGRLTQLAFIVKHWAKRRQVRQTVRCLSCCAAPQHVNNVVMICRTSSLPACVKRR